MALNDLVEAHFCTVRTRHS